MAKATMTWLAAVAFFLAQISGLTSGFALPTFESLVDTVDSVVATVDGVVDKVDVVIPFPSPAGGGKIIYVSFLELWPTHETYTRDLPVPKYFLFTKENPDDPVTLSMNASNMDAILKKSPNFNSSAPLKILIHGFQSSANNSFPQDLMRAYLNQSGDRGEPNVVLVDWSPIAEDFFYFRAAANTEYVGNMTAQLIGSLVAEGLTTVDKVHLIGHSLGAHTSGFVGRAVQELGLGSLARITGLDPAGPGFCVGQEKRLRPIDAEFVDAIHTDGGNYCGILHKAINLATINFGLSSPVGHVDFYPNAGVLQPGCVGGLACSHGRAYELMLESVLHPEAFTGHKCTSWPKYMVGLCEKTETAIMGESTPGSARGTYYLLTGKVWPFSRVHRYFHSLPMVG